MLLIGLTSIAVVSSVTVATSTWIISKLRNQSSKMSLRVDTENLPVLKNDLIIRAARGEKQRTFKAARKWQRTDIPSIWHFCAGEETERAPVWVMRQAGRYLPGMCSESHTLEYVS
jgi:hypothetical protein